MFYEYVDIETGQRVILQRRVADCDPIGAEIEHEGRTLRRVVSVPANGVADVGFRPFTCERVARDLPYAPNKDAEGRPRFETRAEVDRFIGQHHAATGQELGLKVR